MSNKVVFVHLLNDYSGSPKVLSQSINVISQLGYDVELWTANSDGGFLSGIVNKHHHFFYRRFQNRWLTLFSYLISQICLFFKILGYRNEDVIIYVNTLLPFGAALAGKLIKKKVIYHIHESYITPRLLNFFLRFIAEKSACKIIYVSKYLSKKYSKDNLDKTEVLYNAVSDDFLLKAKESHYSPIDSSGKFVVLMVCSLKKYKGVDQFVKLASMLNYKGVEFQLILNAEHDELSTYFNFDIPSNLTLFSKQTDLDAFYSKASMVLNLSLPDLCEETFGLTLVEAMAYGIPVIAPSVGGPTEIVVEEKSGYLISAYNIDSICEKILLLKSRPEICYKLSVFSRMRVEHFSERKFNLGLKKIFSEI